MNRRHFFKSTFGLMAGAMAAPFLPKRQDYAWKEVVSEPIVIDDAYAFKIIGLCNLQVDNPRRLGVISAIS